MKGMKTILQSRFFIKACFLSHTMTELSLDFWLEPGMPCIQRPHMDPKRPGTEIGMVLELHPAEIEAPGTPGKSQGTKIFSSKFLAKIDVFSESFF